MTPSRRLLAALCNVALIAAVGFALLAAFGLLLDASRGQLFVSESVRSQALRAFALVLVPGTAAYLLVPLAARGVTPGEWAVLLQPTNTGPGASSPGPIVIVLRFVLVQAPMLLAAATGVAGFEPAWALLAALAALQVGLLWTARDWNGGAELRLGIVVKDAR